MEKLFNPINISHVTLSFSPLQNLYLYVIFICKSHLHFTSLFAHYFFQCCLCFLLHKLNSSSMLGGLGRNKYAFRLCHLYFHSIFSLLLFSVCAVCAYVRYFYYYLFVELYRAAERIYIRHKIKRVQLLLILSRFIPLLLSFFFLGMLAGFVFVLSFGPHLPAFP